MEGEFTQAPGDASSQAALAAKVGAGNLAAYGALGPAATDLTDAINELASMSFGQAQAVSVRPAQGLTSLQSLGSVSPQISGTGVSRTWADTNYLARRNRLGVVGATTAGSAAGVSFLGLGTGQHSRSLGFQLWTGLGIFAISAATTRAFMGLAGAGLVPTTNAITATTNCIGMGYDETKSNWNLIVNDNSGVPALVDLGSNFPKNVLNSVFDIWLGCAMNGATVYYRIRRLDSPQIATGQITARLPAASATLWGNTSMNNGTDSASGVSMDYLGLETLNPFS